MMASRIWLFGLSFTLAFGCDRSPRGSLPSAEATAEAIEEPHSKLAKPDVMRMSYDATSRVLHLYDLEVGQKWMLSVPWSKRSEPVENDHNFMNELDLEKVAVFYTTSNGQVSAKVTLREIMTQTVSHVRR